MKEKKHPGLRILSVLLVAGVLAAGWILGCRRPADKPAAEPVPVICFLDVGQGDAALLTDGNAAILVDAGTDDAADAVLAALKAAGVKRLDLAVVTHPHADHMGGMDKVLAEVPAALLWLPEEAPDTAEYRELVETAAEGHIPTVHPETGFSWAGGAWSLVCVYDGVTGAEDLNDASLILKADAAGHSVLLAADAGEAEEIAMLDARCDLAADVLKVGHHGSSGSSGEEFLDRVSPRAAVISVGTGNDYDHPHDAALRRLAAMGAEIYRTDWQGTVTCRMTAEGPLFSTEK